MNIDSRNSERMNWKKYVGVGLLFLLIGKAAGQTPTTSLQDTIPATQLIPIIADSLGKQLPLDTVSLTPKQNVRIRKIIPKRATILSAALPGLGQIHNGHWWKVPIIYAGFGTMIYFASSYAKDFRFYREYGIRAYNSSPQETEVPGYSRKITVAQLENGARFSARYRDYNLLGMALLWGVNVIEANVTAHLKTFDISEDLTLQIKPNVMIPAVGGMPVAGVRVAFEFKK